MKKEEKTIVRKNGKIQESIKKRLVSPEIDVIPPKPKKEKEREKEGKKKE